MRLTLQGVFTQELRVVVPLLQRDYAQGRESAKGVRQRFLKALHDMLILPEDDARLPLNLDFIYGSKGAPNEPFAPLDGQQRLTTVFLLHWYLAVQGGRTQHFQAWATVGNPTSDRGGYLKSAFSYRVRPSSTDFFDALVSLGCALDFASLKSDSPAKISDLIADQAWFYQSWRSDPTIDSCLVVLDAIHEAFASTAGLYDRLVSANRPAITFQFLNLENFGLSDDLYIKMNARGKPLTPFETFKASVEQVIDQLLPNATRELGGRSVPLRLYVSQKFDTDWCDLIWSFREERNLYGQTVAHDEIFMNAIRAVALVSLIRHTGAKRTVSKEDAVKPLREGTLHTFHDFGEVECINATFVEDMVTLFDMWARDSAKRDQAMDAREDYGATATFKRVLLGDRGRRDGLSYIDWLHFVGWSLFLIKGLDGAHLASWMRVVSNLARNTIFNRASEFVGCGETLAEMAAWAGPSFVRLVISEPIPKFFEQQVREEKLKASLLVRSAEWTPLVFRAEAHRYFAGQIEFLLAFSGVLDRWLAAGEKVSWNDDEDDALRAAFADYFTRAKEMFVDRDAPGLRPITDYLFERALLCEGDYLLENRTNRGLLDNTDRDLSWKRLLRSELKNRDLDTKRNLVGALLKALDPADVEGSLRRKVDAGVVEGETLTAAWRALLVRHPSLIRYCKKRQLRFVENDSVYLLQGERRNGRHKELHTAALAEELRAEVQRGLGRVRHMEDREAVSDSDRPAVVFKVDRSADESCAVTFQGGRYFLDVHQALVNEHFTSGFFDSPSEVEAALRKL
jgi:hypothetical protein